MGVHTQFSPEEKEFIKQNFRVMTVKEISKHIKRAECSIHAFIRKKMGCTSYKNRHEPPTIPKERRPAPVYTNSKSPYGIADELMIELAYLNPQMSKRIL